jgi:hypothetical protein
MFNEVLLMCLHGTYKWVKVINAEQQNKNIKVDACIADEVQLLNDQGIVTLGCCCGHGQAGKIVEWENTYGKWKGHHEPPHVLIKEESVRIAMELGYRPFPYYYADGRNKGVWQMYLKTGCMTEADCREWHQKNAIPYEMSIGIINI